MSFRLLPPLRALSMTLCATLSACGGTAPLSASFTSEVVQRESCRVVGDGTEACTRDEVTLRLRATLVADELDRAFLYGVPRGGGSDRAILGSLDSQGGWLFEDERVQENERTGCALTERLSLSLRIEDGVDPALLGIDACVALVGREVRQTIASAPCDEVNDPPAEVTRLVRRRWQPAPGCDAGE